MHAYIHTDNNFSTYFYEFFFCPCMCSTTCADYWFKAEVKKYIKVIEERARCRVDVQWVVFGKRTGSGSSSSSNTVLAKNCSKESTKKSIFFVGWWCTARTKKWMKKEMYEKTRAYKKYTESEKKMRTD